MYAKNTVNIISAVIFLPIYFVFRLKCIFFYLKYWFKHLQNNHFFELVVARAGIIDFVYNILLKVRV